MQQKFQATEYFAAIKKNGVGLYILTRKNLKFPEIELLLCICAFLYA